MKTLLLDNYDSFSHILFQYLWEANGERPLFIRNDEWTLDQIRAARFDNIVISPGPGHPGNARDFGVCADVIAAFPDKPILGVCLGLQGLGLAAGVPVVSAPAVRHGKPSPIRHDGKGLFAGLPQGFAAVRYHSLVIPADARAPGLIVTATAGDDGQIMGIRLADRPCFGVQFHPESIGTEHGMALLANFRDLTTRLAAGPAPLASIAPVAPVAESPLAPSAPVRERSAPLRERNAPLRVLEAIELPWRDPETAFAHCFRDEPAAFWLDSQSEPVPGEPRVTYMGTGMRLIEARGRDLRVLERAGDGFAARESMEGDPLAYLDSLLRGAETCRLPESMALPGAFLGGLTGWFGYELKRFTHPAYPAHPAGPASLPDQVNPRAARESDLPDALFLVPDRILAFDPGARKAYAFLPLGPEAGAAPSPEARAWLRRMAESWDGPEFPSLRDPDLRRVPGRQKPFRLPWRLSAPKAEYLSRIRSLQQSILRGETYEACLTNEWRAESGADPFEVYRILRRVNPAPYAAYFRFPHAAVLSASPERFLKLDAQGRLACRPIKGTRRRGATPEEDASLRADLAGNGKDRSENLMIVDLVRNDFGKVCRLGSVAAPELMKVEAHPTVLQLVSTVQGALAEGMGAIDAVRACFPGGSMTGAPKLRTMELLEAREGRPRGVFSGAIGYLGWDGAMDLGMVIRTLIAKDGGFRIGCGGAILAESDPEAEFAEAMLKASASRIAVELAEFGSAEDWNSGG
jgi:para-aminobenzoate synthetase